MSEPGRTPNPSNVSAYAPLSRVAAANHMKLEILSKRKTHAEFERLDMKEKQAKYFTNNPLCRVHVEMIVF